MAWNQIQFPSQTQIHSEMRNPSRPVANRGGYRLDKRSEARERHTRSEKVCSGSSSYEQLDFFRSRQSAPMSVPVDRGTTISGPINDCRRSIRASDFAATRWRGSIGRWFGGRIYPSIALDKQRGHRA